MEVSLRVTWAPQGYQAKQVVGPVPTLHHTVPVPVPFFVTVSEKVLVKVAEAVTGHHIVIVHQSVKTAVHAAGEVQAPKM